MGYWLPDITNAWANFDTLRVTWPNTLNRGTIYRLTCKQVLPGFTTCNDAGCQSYEYDVQFMIADRHNQDAVFKSWASPGVPSYSSDALVTGQYGFSSAPDVPDTFPGRICKSGLCPEFLDYLGVLGIALPDMVTRPAPGLGSRFRLIPEKDYPDAFSMPHNKRAGDFDFNFLGTWSTYWALRAKEIAFEHFGTTRPRPELHADYAFRLVYVHSHRGFQIQRAFRPGATVDWQQFDTTTGSPQMHLSFNDIVSLVFDGNSIDHPPSAQLYNCDTVLGIHAPVNPAYTLANYSYANFAHKKETGSFDFKTVGCGGQDCEDPGTTTEPIPSDCACPDVPLLTFIEGSESIGRPLGRVDGDEKIGYVTDPTSGNPYVDQNSVMLENMMATNIQLQRLVSATCALVCENRNLREMLAHYLAIIAAQQVTVDLTPIENAIKEHTQWFDNAWVIRP